MEKGSILGLPISFATILGGMVMEGGHISSIMGLPAFIIVFGGATGAVLLDIPFESTILGIKNLKLIFLGGHHDHNKLVEEVSKLASVARKDGLLALEKERANISDPLLAEGVKYAVDGLEPNLVQQIIEARVDFRMHAAEMSAKFYTQMGAYCPTVGILGAVLGLIHVMENLDNPAAIGPGIATAFIATVYGVGGSNLVFLPMGNKLKAIAGHEGLYFEMIKQGIRNIQLGTSPSIIASHMLSIVDEEAKEEEKA